MSPIKRMTSAFSSAGDRSSRVPGGDMPLQNLKSLYAESPDLPIFTRAVSPCPPRLPPAKPPLPGLLPLLLSMQQGASGAENTGGAAEGITGPGNRPCGGIGTGTGNHARRRACCRRDLRRVCVNGGTCAWQDLQFLRRG